MKPGNRGFTVWELIIVLIVLGILAAILFPVFNRGHGHGYSGRSACQSNLKQIGLGLRQYTQDYDEKLPFVRNFTDPGTDSWTKRIEPYIKTNQLFRCPGAGPYTGAADGVRVTTYYLNANLAGVAIHRKKQGANLLMAGEGEPASGNYACRSLDSCVGFNQTGPVSAVPVAARERHLAGANYLLVDGHVKFLLPHRIRTVQTTNEQYTFAPL